MSILRGNLKLMLIDIAERLRPFTHLPGNFHVLPGSSLRLQIFPTFIAVEDISEAIPVTLSNLKINILSKLKEFTVQQDLEKGRIVVWGRQNVGFLRYTIQALKGAFGVIFCIEKGVDVHFSSEGSWDLLPLSDKKNSFFLGPKTKELLKLDFYRPPILERLSLGNHKSQDWSSIYRRGKMEEIFPLWHRLGQQVLLDKVKNQEKSSFFEPFRYAIEHREKKQIIPFFLNLFLENFDFMLTPRLVDTDHRGNFTHLNLKGSPLSLLTEGQAIIRSLFIHEDEAAINILPFLPEEFHCGRLINIACGKSGVLCMEWNKKALRSMTFHAKENQVVTFNISQSKTKCRIRTSYQDKGKAFISSEPVEIKANQSYWFDNFKK